MGLFADPVKVILSKGGHASRASPVVPFSWSDALSLPPRLAKRGPRPTLFFGSQNFPVGHSSRSYPALASD